MATANVNCIFDSHRGYGMGGQVNESGTYMPIFIPPQSGFMQFNIPNLEEIYLSSAKLFLYVEERGSGIKVTPTLYNVTKSLAGENSGFYDDFIRSGLIAKGADIYTSGSAAGDRQYTSLDITELIIGYLGRNYYTLGLVGERIVENPTTPKFGTIEGGNAAYIQLNYEYATPFKPTIVYPVGEAISNTGNITFQWKYNSSGTTGQQKFDLRWKMQASTTWNTVSQTTGNTYYTMNANAFTNGIVEWQVRTYNRHNMASEWAESQFVVIGKPGNPVISGVRNDAMTEITWNANKAEESAARVKIKKAGVLVYDSGVIPGGIEDAHKPDLILDNGNYVALLSISNMYDMWSNEISYPFTISNTKPPTPALMVATCGDYVKLTYTFVADAEYIIYRAEGEGEFIPVKRTRATEYNDYAVRSNVQYRYFVRCYKKAYSDSAVKDIYVQYKGYFLSSVADMGNRVNLLYHDTEMFMPVERRMKNDNALILYTGRKKPVKESGTHISETVSITVFVTRKNQAQLEEIYRSNGIFCLRNADFVMYCDVVELGGSMSFFNKGYLLNLTFETVDYEEKVRFDE